MLGARVLGPSQGAGEPWGGVPRGLGRPHGGLRGCWLFHRGGCPLLMISVLSGNMSAAECGNEEEGSGRLWGCQA